MGLALRFVVQGSFIRRRPASLKPPWSATFRLQDSSVSLRACLPRACLFLEFSRFPRIYTSRSKAFLPSRAMPRLLVRVGNYLLLYRYAAAQKPHKHDLLISQVSKVSQLHNSTTNVGYGTVSSSFATTQKAGTDIVNFNPASY